VAEKREEKMEWLFFFYDKKNKFFFVKMNTTLNRKMKKAT